MSAADPPEEPIGDVPPESATAHRPCGICGQVVSPMAFHVHVVCVQCGGIKAPGESHEDTCYRDHPDETKPTRREAIEDEHGRGD